MELFTPAKALDAYLADYSTVLALAEVPMIRDHGLDGHASTGPSHRADVFATLAVRLPTLIGDVVLLLARDRTDDAAALIADALIALKTTDPVLFEPSPTTETFAKTVGRLMAVTTARAHARNAGDVERRRENHVLHWKFINEGTPDRPIKDPPRRSGQLGLPPLAVARLVLDETLEGQTNPTIKQTIERWATAATATPEADAVEPADTIQNEKEVV